MIKRTIQEFDLRHTGDEMDRLELLAALRSLADLCGHNASVEVESVKSDLVYLKIETVESP